jgi:putative transcriptional regulator
MRKWLQEKRQENNLTQEDVAKASGIQRAYYTMIENGTRQPSVQVAQKIAGKMGFNWTIFFENKGNETTHKATSA